MIEGGLKFLLPRSKGAFKLNYQRMARLLKDRFLPTEISGQKVEDKSKDDKCRVYGCDGLKKWLSHRPSVLQMSIASHVARTVSWKVPPISEPQPTSIAEHATKPNAISMALLCDHGWTQNHINIVRVFGLTHLCHRWSKVALRQIEDYGPAPWPEECPKGRCTGMTSGQDLSAHCPTSSANHRYQPTSHHTWWIGGTLISGCGLY